MTRERLPPNPIMQKAYGALDRYKISRTFFQRTEQEGCLIAASELNAAQGWVSEPNQSVETGAGKSAGPILEDRIDTEKKPLVEVPQVPEQKESEKKPLKVAEHILKNTDAEKVEKEKKQTIKVESETKSEKSH